MPDRPEGAARPISLLRPLLLGATVLTVVTSAQHWTVMQLDAESPSWRTVSHALNREAPFWYLWVLAAPVVAWAVRRFPLAQGRLPLAIPVHVLTGTVLIACHHAALYTVYWVTPYPSSLEPSLAGLARSLPFRFAVEIPAYGLLLGVVVAVSYYRRYQEREIAAAELGRQLAEARLQALRMQLNPHFLFNAMNSIAMLVRRKADTEAVRMLAGLSDILRHVLVESPAVETALKDEIAFIERYLAIEKARFGDRLQVEIEVPPEAREALVPTLILQPLVENAVRHGIAHRRTGGTIAIAARIEDGVLTLSVTDDGPGRTESAVTPASGISIGTGIGLANTRSRLAQLYGDAAGFQLTRSADGRTVARATLPLRRSPVELELAEVSP